MRIDTSSFRRFSKKLCLEKNDNENTWARWQSKISSPCGLNCPERLNGINAMKKYDLQSIRNLRRRDSATNLGVKAIIFCDECKRGHTSEDIAIALLCRVLGRLKVLEGGEMPTYKEGLWEKSGFVSNAFINAEMLLLKESIPPAVGRKRNAPFRVNSNVLSVIGALRNLHKTMHPKKCCIQKSGLKRKMQIAE